MTQVELEQKLAELKAWGEEHRRAKCAMSHSRRSQKSLQQFNLMQEAANSFVKLSNWLMAQGYTPIWNNDNKCYEVLTTM